MIRRIIKEFRSRADRERSQERYLVLRDLFDQSLSLKEETDIEIDTTSSELNRIRIEYRRKSADVSQNRDMGESLTRRKELQDLKDQMDSLDKKEAILFAKRAILKDVINLINFFLKNLERVSRSSLSTESDAELDIKLSVLEGYLHEESLILDSAFDPEFANKIRNLRKIIFS